MNPPLDPGQCLHVKHRNSLAKEDLAILEYLDISRHGTSVYVTWADSAGMSFYATTYSKVLEGFIPAGGVGMRNWRTFFEPGETRNPSYISLKQKHSTKVFPKDFVPQTLLSH
jgi:hypothetical protein